MKKLNYVIAIICWFACVCLCACSEKKIGDNDPKVLYAPLRHQKRTDLCHFDSLFESIDTIQLKLVGEESLLGKMIEIKSISDTLFISSNNSIYLFDYDGQFIKRINKKGRGRGEYLQIEHFDINKTNRELIILDAYGGRKFFFYSYNGDFIRQIEVPDIVDDFLVLENGDLLCYCPKYFGRGNRGLWQIDSLGNYKKHLVEMDDAFQYTYALDRYMTHISDDEIGLMGSEDFDYFYNIKDGRIDTAFVMKTDYKLPNKYKRTGDYPDDSRKAYVKCEYIETKDLLYFILTNGFDDVQVFYNKKDDVLYRFYVDDISLIKRPQDIIPTFCSSHLGKIFYYYDAGKILKDEYYKQLFPNITEQSNPVVFVCNSFE